MKVFPFFLNFSNFRPSSVHWAKIFSRKIPQNKFGTCLDTFRNVFGHFWNFNFFRFFFRIFPSFDHRGCTGQIFLPKKLPRSMFKMCLTFSGNVFGHFEKKMKVFPFFWCFSMLRPSRVHWANFFSEKYLKTSSKFVWKLLRTFLDTFRNSNFFDSFFEFLISRVHWSRKIRKKSPQNKFGHFWKRFSGFWKFNFFSIFLKFFDFSTLQGALNKKSRKNHIKTCLDNLGNVFGHFWKFEIFSISVELFRVSKVHWAEFFSVEIIMQHMIKQCFWERFWRILKVSKFFHFFVFFASFDHPGCTGQKFFPEKYLKTSSELVWKLLRTFLDTFRNSIFFNFCSNFWSPGCTGK